MRFVTIVVGLIVWGGCGGDDGPGGGELVPPTIDAVGSPTNDNPITLTGTADPGLVVQVRGGAEAVVESTVGGDGRYSASVPLRTDAENTLLVSQTDGTVESAGAMVVVVHDGTPPDTPSLDPVTTPTRRPMQNVRGSTEPGAIVLVQGGAEDAMGIAGDDGRFDVEVTLQTAVADITQNDLMVVATDEAGNASEPTLATIVHNPTLPLDAPVLDALPGATSDPMLTVTGQADPTVSITVSGGDAPAMGMAGADGRFSVDVMLRVNVENVLSVFAVVPATGLSSPPATAVIVHDDVPPDPPSLDPLGSPTGATTVRVSGQSEPRAQIQISGGMADVADSADDDGAFGIDVMLNLDAVNDLVVLASDAAGNTSMPATASVTQDSSLPDPVRVDAVASPTSDDPITLTGSTQPSAALTISGGASIVMLTSAGDGSFSASVPLNTNARNELRITRDGSGVDTVVVVVHDDRAPAAPSLDPIATPTNRIMIDVAGSSEPGARISVSGATTTATGTADGAGRFSIAVTVATDATTSLSVISTDRAGNSSAPATAMVVHSSTVPDAPVVDDVSPPPTNVAMHTITGRVTAPGMGVSILVRGGAAPAMGSTDPSTGSFSVNVALNTNAVNTLSVVGVEGMIESPATNVTIEHDDIAPAAPDGSRISLGRTMLATCLARTETINVTGGAMAVEAFSRARVRNITEGSLSAAASAAADGSFSTTITACAGDVLRLTATDAASNTSMSTELTVTN